MPWEFKRESFTRELIPEGVHRVRIKSADKLVSSKGNDMLMLQFDVSGYKRVIYHYIVFLDDRPEITNRNLTQFFDSFKDIEEGDFNTKNWIGKVGAARIVHEEYEGDMKEKIKGFVHRNKQDALPAWQEPDNGNGGEFTPVPDSEPLPF